MDQLKCFKRPIFLREGSKNTNGFQIFTPKFMVDSMLKAVGVDNILDYSKTILEPASGDGAFTCRILSMRLKKVSREHPGLDSLKALSSIYSLEIDKRLIIRQRNNIYTIMMNFAKKYKIESEQYIQTVRDIILTNFCWAKTNYEYKYIYSLFGSNVAYQMHEGDEEQINPVTFYSWKINNDFTYEKNRMV